MIRNLLILAFLCILPMDMSAQLWVGYRSDSVKIAEYREEIGLDYSMPDYSIKKIDVKVMGPRLAKLLESLCTNYTQPPYLGTLSVIQSGQIEDLDYVRIKSMKLGDVTKTGNELTIRYNTTLEHNKLNLKKTQLVFHFVDGVSEDIATNDFFCVLCRYIRE